VCKYWFYSSYNPIENTKLENKRKKILVKQETIEIKFDNLSIKCYNKLDNNKKLKENILYTLEASNKIFVNIFFKLNSCFYII